MEEKTLQSKEELAKGYYLEGCNCAQAVFLAFAKNLGLDAPSAAKIALSFGGGMGRGETCGALTGALMALGLSESGAIPPAKEDKVHCLSKAKLLASRFEETFGTTLCRQLLAQAEGKKVCPKAVGFMAKELEEILKNTI